MSGRGGVESKSRKKCVAERVTEALWIYGATRRGIFPQCGGMWGSLWCMGGSVTLWVRVCDRKSIFAVFIKNTVKQDKTRFM